MKDQDEDLTFQARMINRRCITAAITGRIGAVSAIHTRYSLQAKNACHQKRERKRKPLKNTVPNIETQRSHPKKGSSGITLLP